MDNIRIALASGSPTTLFTTLRGCPLESMPFMETFDLLTSTLDECTRLRVSSDLLKMVILRWRAIFGSTDIYEAVGDIAGIAAVSIDTLAYLVSTLAGLKIIDVFYSHLNKRKMGDGPIFGLMVDRLLMAKAVELSYETWSALYTTAEMRGRSDAMTALRDKMVVMADPAPYPNWVSRRGIEQDLDPALFTIAAWSEYKAQAVDQKMLSETLKTFDGAVVTKDEEEQAIPHEVLEDIARVALAGGTEPDDLHGPTAAADPDRIFGPLNIIVGRECTTSIAGGCRMLTCCCREPTDDEENPLTVWFTGLCDNCELRIEDISHAIRHPVFGGGWIGCFCSMECLRANPDAETREDHPELAFNTMTELLLMRMLSMIEFKGILNRKLRPAQPMREHKATRVDLLEDDMPPAPSNPLPLPPAPSNPLPLPTAPSNPLPLPPAPSIPSTQTPIIRMLLPIKSNILPLPDDMLPS